MCDSGGTVGDPHVVNDTNIKTNRTDALAYIRGARLDLCGLSSGSRGEKTTPSPAAFTEGLGWLPSPSSC